MENTTKKMSSIETAKAIYTKAKELGFTLSVRNGIVSVSSICPPGADRNDWFRNCDMSYGDVLGMIPRTSPGSEWGTDGGSVGGWSAMKSGYFTMNKSGCSKRVCAALHAYRD